MAGDGTRLVIVLVDGAPGWLAGDSHAKARGHARGARAEPVSSWRGRRSGPPALKGPDSHVARHEPGCHRDRRGGRDPGGGVPVVGRPRPTGPGPGTAQASAPPLNPPRPGNVPGDTRPAAPWNMSPGARRSPLAFPRWPSPAGPRASRRAHRPRPLHREARDCGPSGRGG